MEVRVGDGRTRCEVNARAENDTRRGEYEALGEKAIVTYLDETISLRVECRAAGCAVAPGA